jgi:16S rRNA (cytidine1402-2'-O)-methyltransferase
MQIQKSFEPREEGTLYVVPTPIGNLEDITYRALSTLKTVSIIAAEDTRNTKKLLNHFEITTPLLSYHEHNKMEREKQLLDKLANGESIALVSDAGMPAISDPGYEIVEAAIEHQFTVVVLPGANAALCALVGSGLPSREFLFYGFLPRKQKEKEAELERLGKLKATLLIYESPYRVKDTLKTIAKVLGNRKMAIARELTKRFEEFVRGTLEELVNWADEQELKGEFCIVIEGSSEESLDTEENWWDSLDVISHVEHYIQEKDMSSKDAIKQVAKDRDLPKRDIYQIYHIQE